MIMNVVIITKVDLWSITLFFSNLDPFISPVSGNMSVILIFLLSFQSISGLQSKLFGKNLIDPSSISSEEIKKSSIAMDKITCSTLCLRDNCEAFYFKDNACMIIKDATGMTQATNTQEALTVFINENPKEIEVGTLFQGHILVHPEQWTPYIYKSEPSTNY